MKQIVLNLILESSKIRLLGCMLLLYNSHLLDDNRDLWRWKLEDPVPNDDVDALKDGIAGFPNRDSVQR